MGVSGAVRARVCVCRDGLGDEGDEGGEVWVLRGEGVH